MTHSWRFLSARESFYVDWYASRLYQRARLSPDYKIFNVIRPTTREDSLPS